MIQSLIIREASSGDSDDLLRVINEAFVVEEFFTPGPRLTALQLAAYQARGIFLLAETNGVVAGCVFVETAAPTGYFGLLSVDRTLQQRGLGSKLVAAAEDHCRREGCSAITIRVVNLRTELPPFYRARGYAEIGTEPFDHPGNLLPCHFIVMSKSL